MIYCDYCGGDDCHHCRPDDDDIDAVEEVNAGAAFAPLNDGSTERAILFGEASEKAKKSNEKSRDCSFSIRVFWDEHGVRHEPPTTNDFEFDATMPPAVKMMVADLMTQAATIVYQIAEHEAARGEAQTKSGLVVPTRGPIAGLN